MAIGFTTNKAWFDKAFVGIGLQSTNDVEARSFTTSLAVSGGNADLDTLEVFSGKISKPSTREDFELSFDAIAANTRDFDWIAHGVNPTTNAITTYNSNAKFRVTLLWTDATGITAASMTVGTAGEAYRQSYAELYSTALEYNMDAGEELTASLTFKGAVEDETGGQNYKKETKTSGATLSALAQYSTSAKF